MTRRAPLLLLSLLVLAGCDPDPASDDDGGVTPAPDAGPRADGATPATDGAIAEVDGSLVGVDAGPMTPPRSWSRLDWEDCEGTGRTLEAGPDDYRSVLDTIAAGDTLRLRPGTYERGLPLTVSGEEGRCIVVEALDPSQRPLFTGSNSFNVVAVHGASWLKIRGLEVDIRGLDGFGFASQGGASKPTDHVVIEDNYIHGFGTDQQIVGISTKSPATDWVIRGNRIVGPGTGLYLGNSDGTLPFVRGLIEFNTVIDSVGYCMQIKHQTSRSDAQPDHAETIIRYNVFAKTNGMTPGSSARPNLLLGHFPTEGRGADDLYVLYGNVLYDNSTENLLQAEGNLLIVNNVFVNPNGGAITIRPHNAVPRRVDVAFNTIVASGRGLHITGGNPAFAQRSRNNLIFADPPLAVADSEGDVTGTTAEAAGYLRAPLLAAGAGLDLHPLALAGLEATADAGLPERLETTHDFDGAERTAAIVGAFVSVGAGAITLEAPPIPE